MMTKLQLAERRLNLSKSAREAVLKRLSENKSAIDHLLWRHSKAMWKHRRAESRLKEVNTKLKTAFSFSCLGFTVKIFKN